MKYFLHGNFGFAICNFDFLTKPFSESSILADWLWRYRNVTPSWPWQSIPVSFRLPWPSSTVECLRTVGDTNGRWYGRSMGTDGHVDKRLKRNWNGTGTVLERYRYWLPLKTEFYMKYFRFRFRKRLGTWRPWELKWFILPFNSFISFLHYNTHKIIIHTIFDERKNLNVLSNHFL